VPTANDKLVAVLRFIELFGTASRPASRRRLVHLGQRHGTAAHRAIQNIPGAHLQLRVGFISNSPHLVAPLCALTDTVAVSLSALACDYARASGGLQQYPDRRECLGIGTQPNRRRWHLWALRPLVSIPPTPLHPSWPNWLAPRLVKTAQSAPDRAQWRPMAAPVSSTGTSQAVWKSSRPSEPRPKKLRTSACNITFKNNIPQNTGSVQTLSYAPTPTAPFSASGRWVASNSLTIPRSRLQPLPPERIS